MGLKYTDLLKHGFFFFDKYSTVNAFSLPYDFLNTIFFSLGYFIVRIQYRIHITYGICVHGLFMLLVRPSVNSKFLAVKFWRVRRHVWIFGYMVDRPSESLRCSRGSCTFFLCSRCNCVFPDLASFSSLTLFWGQARELSL